MRIEMPWEVEWIIKTIRDHGFEAFAVGGCVRDRLLGRTPGDWDITTSARPEDVKKIFKKTVDTGLKHGTVTVIKDRRGYEVTTYRIDGEYGDGRHPDSVEFTKSLEEDLKRRDFTINAMAYSHETGIVDVFGGREDLKERRIRCVGEPMDRFSEDALRILRAVRFAAQLDFSIEERTGRAIAAIAPNLSKVSRERIQTELTKLLLSDHTERLLTVWETGISSYVTEGFEEVFERTGRAEEDYGCLSVLPAEKSLRWAGFLRRGTGSEAVKILRGLKLDNETIGTARAMVDGLREELLPEKPAVRRLLSRVTEWQFEGILALKEMEGEPGIPRLRAMQKEILEAGDCISMKSLAVDGNDLMEAGMKPGKELGRALAFLFGLVLENPELNEKNRLLARLKDQL